MLCGKSLVKESVLQTDFSFPRYLHIFMNVEKYDVTYMYVMILLIYFVILYFICFLKKKKKKYI